MIHEKIADGVDIYLGDCHSVMSSMEGETVDLFLTSPPYPGVNNMWGELYKDYNFEKAHIFLDSVWDEGVRLLRPGCKMIINIANTKRRPYLPNVARVHWWAKDKIEPTGEIIWHKGYGQCGTAWGSFRSPSDPALADQHEYILVFRKFGDRHKPETFEKIDLHDFKSWRNSVWQIAPESAKEIGHCAPFPVQIPLRLVTLYTFAGEAVVDPFMGSGTTGVACIRAGRKFIGIENNEEYFNVARDRLIEALRQPKLDFSPKKIMKQDNLFMGERNV